MLSRDATGSDSSQFYYEMDPTERFSEAVINAVTAASDYEPVGTPGRTDRVLAPLYGAVDPDALDALLGETPSAGNGADLISFDYEEFAVTVESCGRVRVVQR